MRRAIIHGAVALLVGLGTWTGLSVHSAHASGLIGSQSFDTETFGFAPECSLHGDLIESPEQTETNPLVQVKSISTHPSITCFTGESGIDMQVKIDGVLCATSSGSTSASASCTSTGTAIGEHSTDATWQIRGLQPMTSTASVCHQDVDPFVLDCEIALTTHIL